MVDRYELGLKIVFRSSRSEHLVAVCELENNDLAALVLELLMSALLSMGANIVHEIHEAVCIGIVMPRFPVVVDCVRWKFSIEAKEACSTGVQALVKTTVFAIVDCDLVIR